MTHYTKQQWQAYIQGDELERPPMDDHLQECDECNDIYLIAIEELHAYLPQLSSIPVFAEGVFDRIESLPKSNTITHQAIDNRKWYTKTLFHYTIAASITLVLVGSGMFDQMLDRVSQISLDTEKTQNTSVSNQLTNKAGQWLDAIPTNYVKKEGKP